MSRNALRKYPTTHCNNLESLYYLFCFIITAHTGPNLSTSRLPHAGLPEDLKLWFLGQPSFVAVAKKGHLDGEDFMLPVQNVFNPLEPLAVKLHGFLHTRVRYDKYGVREPPPYPFTPEQDFSEFLGYFEETIEEMGFNPKQGTEDSSHDDAEENLGGFSKGTSGHPKKRAPEDIDRDMDRDTKRARAKV
jgi:hypothetical protein